jgi:tetratricopeptide (TPR) repeat protein
MHRLSRSSALAIAIGVLTTIATPTHSQQLSQAWGWCKKNQSRDVAFKGCTIIIQSRKETPENRAVAYSNRGTIWLSKKDYDRAVSDYDEAIKLDPNNPLPRYNRGTLWLQTERYDRAISDLDYAISLNPENFEYYNNRGRSYFLKGDYNRAIVDYNEVIRLRPTYAGGYTNRGAAWSTNGEYDRAIEDYSASLRLDPGFVNAFWGRAEAYLKKHDYGHSARDFEAAINLDPKSPHWWNGRCFARAAMGRLQDALADCNESLRLKTDGAEARGSRGLVYLKLARFDEAIADYDEALRLNPTLAGALYGRGVAKIRKGNSKAGEADIAAATAIRADVTEEFARYGVPPSPLEPAAPKLPVAIAIASVPTASSVATTERRVALVIGNSGYSKAPRLPNPRRDAETVASTLRRVGFETVTLEADLTRDGFTNVLRNFASVAEKSDWAVIYFAGHGVEMDGVNYLIPVDASLATDRDVTFEAVPLGQILTAVDGAKKLRLVVLDACRNNPFLNQMRRTAASRSIGRGLGRVEPEAGTLVVYAAKHGELAMDGDERNSPFVEALTHRIVTPGLEVRRLFDIVRDDVIAATNRKQQPFSYGSVSGSEDFYFVAR